MNESIKDCYFDGWKKTFVYTGRATRKAFWSFIVINIMIFVFIAAMSYLLLVVSVSDSTSRGGMMLVWTWYVWLPLNAIAPLILLLPLISLGIRRMHDAGRSGWWFGGGLLTQLLILPLFLNGLYRVLLSRTAPADQIVSAISSLSGCIGLLYLIWVCCLPTKVAAPKVI
ncbi:DUF805 domain-containing protein [Leclercia adecarboxylata]|uniref:DUF805 domain-containing protein n=1 Tax=Leclercia adecarboxylata TaxID=83655 RepID=UPI002DB9466B|nr:DUF805 domain-containing protein [Leclercia adecarboxylata]MEB6378213.1 DUF805 domain-containing protein [Leclercia adecarboxylata]